MCKLFPIALRYRDMNPYVVYVHCKRLHELRSWTMRKKNFITFLKNRDNGLLYIRNLICDAIRNKGILMKKNFEPKTSLGKKSCLNYKKKS